MWTRDNNTRFTEAIANLNSQSRIRRTLNHTQQSHLQHWLKDNGMLSSDIHSVCFDNSSPMKLHLFVNNNKFWICTEMTDNGRIWVYPL
jgi:hypothetical protein